MLTSIESAHYQNFVDAIRADNPKLLTCDIHEGHMSSALPQLANIAYRTGRQLAFDSQAEKFVNDKEADRLLSRDFGGTLRRFVDQVLAQPRVQRPAPAFDFWDQVAQAEAMEELRMFRPAAFQALPKATHEDTKVTKQEALS